MSLAKPKHPRVFTRRSLPLYVMILPPAILVLIYSYGPMFGLVMAFQRFEPASGFFGSPWVGLENFRRILAMPDVREVVWNTLYIAVWKIIVETIAAILVAILLNEVRSRFFKRTVQTIIYFPYFLSWVILGGILRDVLARDGLFNIALGAIGIKPIVLLGNAKLFPWTLVWTETWQQTGFGTIVFLAAISNISPSLYEAAAMDGAGRLRQTWHITLPGMAATITLMIVLSMGYILSAGFEQVLMLYSPVVYSTGDVIDTWVYRAGLKGAQYSLGAAVGLFRSLVSLIMISSSYWLANKWTGYRVF